MSSITFAKSSNFEATCHKLHAIARNCHQLHLAKTAQRKLHSDILKNQIEDDSFGGTRGSSYCVRSRRGRFFHHPTSNKHANIIHKQCISAPPKLLKLDDSCRRQTQNCFTDVSRAFSHHQLRPQLTHRERSLWSAGSQRREIWLHVGTPLRPKFFITSEIKLRVNSCVSTLACELATVANTSQHTHTRARTYSV